MSASSSYTPHLWYEPAAKSSDKLWLLIGFLLAAVPLTLNGFYIEYIFRITDLFWPFDILNHVVLPALGITLILKKTKFTVKNIGLGAPKTVQAMNLLILGTVLSLFLSEPIYHNTFQSAQLNYPEFRPAIQFNYSQTLPDTGLLLLLCACYISVTAGVVEEIFFTAIPKLFFKTDILGSCLYVVISAFLFSLIHWEGGLWQLHATFAFGVFTSVVYLFSRSIIPCIIGHFWVDWIIFSH